MCTLDDPRHQARPSLPTFLFLGLIAADLCLIATDIGVRLARESGVPVTAAWIELTAIDRTGSLGEVFGYVKLAAAALALTAAGILARSGALALLAAVPALLVLDDALEIHEHLGALLAAGPLATLGPPETVHHAGEFMALAGFAAILIPIFLTAARTAPPVWRPYVKATGAGLVALGLCAIVLDLASGLLGPMSRVLNKSLLLAEDGGEMLAMSLLAAAAAAVLHRAASLAGSTRRTGDSMTAVR